MPACPIPLVRCEIAPADTKANHSVVLCLRKVAHYLDRNWCRCLLLTLIGVIVHSSALQGQRIWDDEYLAHDNPFIKSPLLILESFRHYLFLDSFSAHYRPVQNLSFIIDYFFWNTDEFGFHLTNVLLHVGSGILLYFLLRQLFASLWLRGIPPAVRERASRRLPWISRGAFLIALLWLVHPVHSAAVDYISGRADSLAFFFAAAGWLLFRRAQCITRAGGRASIYFLAAICGLLALLSRETGCIWIALFLAHLFLIERQLSRCARVGVLCGCLAIVALYFGLRQLPHERLTSTPQAGWTAPVRTVLMARALGDYTRLMIFPSNLHMERTVFDPAFYKSNADWRASIGLEYLSILGLILLAALVFGSIKTGRGRAARIFGALWFLAAYLPISNIVQLNATVAEHWLYLPSVGLLVFLAGCAVELPSRYRHIITGTATVALIGLSCRSFVRSSDWANEETFYKRTIAVGGTSVRTGVNLGRMYSARGAYAEAEKIFRQVLDSVPDYPVALNNLADVLTREGKKAEAEKIFAAMDEASAKTRTEYPRTWMGAVNHARMRYNAKDYQAALAILDKARADYPRVWEIISLQSEILREKQGPGAALKLVEDFARDNWWHYGAAVALGRLYAQRGDTNRAESQLRHASWLDVHDAEALRLIVMMRLRENRLDEAFQTQRRAIAREPDEPRQYILLSEILEKMGRDDEAHAALVQVNRLQALAKSQTAFN
jgi:tetratricopeptide (TPR) repeat protein